MLKIIYLFLIIFSFYLPECQGQKHSELNAIAFFSGIDVITGKTTSSPLNAEYEFYREGANQIDNKTIFLDCNDERLGKIKSVYSPTKETCLQPLFFFYEKGVTTIFETSTQATIYRHNNENLIQSIEQYERLPSDLLELYRKEIIYWEAFPSGFRPMRRVLEDRNGLPHVCFSFFYDQEGVLKQEVITGNLSGKCAIPIVIDQNGSLESNGVESYCTTYRQTINNQKTNEIQEAKYFENSLYNPQNTLFLIPLSKENAKAETILNQMFSLDEESTPVNCLYDSFGRLSSIEFPNFIDEYGNISPIIIKQEHNIYNLVSKIILPSGMEICIHYNSRGQCTDVNYSDGTFESHLYCLDGRLMESFLRDGSHYIFLDTDESELKDEKDTFTNPYDIEDKLDEILSILEANEEEFQHEKSFSTLFYFCIDQLKNMLKIVNEKIKEEPTLVKSFNESFDSLAKTLCGNYYELLGCSSEETIKDSYGDKDLNEKVRISFINGMLNSKNMMLENLDFLSKAHGDVKVHYVFRPTQGWVWDISRAILIKFGYTFGFRSKHAHLLAELWKSLIDEMGGINNGGIILHYAHSLGGTETDRAHDLLSPEEQKMIRVTTIGSATFVNHHHFQRVENHVSINDGVHFLDPWGHLRHFLFGNNHIQFHGLFSRTSLPIIDHMLERNTYKNLISRLGKEFLAEFSAH